MVSGNGHWALGVKRLIDVALSGAGLVLSAPVLAASALAIRATMGSPVLFRQARPGHHAKLFTIYKFRTMRDAVDSKGRVLPDSERVTKLGQFLRKASIDELPQLWNILKGDMSLIGPRPLLVEFLETYTPEQARRHEVKPGITGWAQVNGRHRIPYSQRLELDVWYVEHWSLWLDFKIMVRTVVLLLKMLGTEAVENKAGMDDMGLFGKPQGD